MRIAFIGASGNVGSKIVTEALNRGHLITAIVRHPEKMYAGPGVTVLKGDISLGHSESALEGMLMDHEAVISAVPFQNVDPHILITAVKEAGVPRLLVVGGAGSLLLPDGTRVIDSPGFPDAYKAEASAGSAFLDALKAEKGLDWTFVSPSAEIAPGERTENFRLGKDDLLVDANGKSHISQEDFAIAFIDELENPQHSRARFTVGY